jgi:hypothetical protein
LEELQKNVNLEIFECDSFREIRGSSRNKSEDAAWVEYEKPMLQKLERFLLLNKAGRRIESHASINPSLCPVVLERINRVDFFSEPSWGDAERERAFKADAIYEFLQGPLSNPILFGNS